MGGICPPCRKFFCTMGFATTRRFAGRSGAPSAATGHAAQRHSSTFCGKGNTLRSDTSDRPIGPPEDDVCVPQSVPTSSAVLGAPPTRNHVMLGSTHMAPPPTKDTYPRFVCSIPSVRFFYLEVPFASSLANNCLTSQRGQRCSSCGSLCAGLRICVDKTHRIFNANFNICCFYNTDAQ